MGISSVQPEQFRAVVVAAGQFALSATIPSTATTVNGFVGSVAVQDAQLGDFVIVTPATAQTAGVAFHGIVTAAGTISITCMNGSGGAYNPGAQVFNILVLRLRLA